MFDYNANGAQYAHMAFRRATPGSGFIRPEGVHTIEWCQTILQDQCKNKDIRGQTIEKLHCAFDRLEGLYLIAQRIVNLLTDLPKQAQPAIAAAPAQIAIPSSAVFVDFGSLVYHGASTLDVLAGYVRQETGVAKGKFRGLKNAIYNTQPVDLRADDLWGDLDIFEREIQNVFTDYDGYKGLRNFIAHENSILGLSSYVFTFLSTPDRKLLCFDTEFEMQRASDSQKKHYSLTEIVEKICSYVGWITCRTAIHYLTRGKNYGPIYNPSSIPMFGPDKFRSLWNNPYVKFSEYISDDPKHPKFSITRITYNGFQTHNRHLAPSVLSKLVQF